VAASEAWRTMAWPLVLRLAAALLRDCVGPDRTTTLRVVALVAVRVAAFSVRLEVRVSVLLPLVLAATFVAGRLVALAVRVGVLAAVLAVAVLVAVRVPAFVLAVLALLVLVAALVRSVDLAAGVGAARLLPAALACWALQADDLGADLQGSAAASAMRGAPAAISRAAEAAPNTRAQENAMM